MKIQKTPPYNPTSGWSIRTQTTRYGKNVSSWSEYMLDNGKRLVTIHTSIEGKKMIISKTLYDGYKILKEKMIRFVDGVRKVERII